MYPLFSHSSSDVNFHEFWDFFGNKDDGKVKCYSINEMREYMIKHGMEAVVNQLSSEEFQAVFDTIDADGSGTIDFWEFWSFFGNNEERDRKLAEVSKARNGYDEDKSLRSS